MTDKNTQPRFHLGNRHSTAQQDTHQPRPRKRAAPERIDGGIALLLTAGYAFR